MQFGFDFQDEKTSYRKKTIGFWNQILKTKCEYFAFFDGAVKKLASLSGIEFFFFSSAIEASIAEHEKQIGHNNPPDDKKYFLWRSDFDYSKEQFNELLMLCETKQFHEGATVKVRQSIKETNVALYIEGVGTLKMYRSGDEEKRVHVDYCPFKSKFFEDSYLDDAESIYAPYKTWGNAYAAQTIAESNTQPASVKTFSFNGREFVNKGGMSCKSWHDCNAYSICALSDWNGDTFNHKELLEAFNTGAVERGDCRGLVVKVRGVLCVLEKFFIFYDDNVKSEDRDQVYHDDNTDENEEGEDLEEEEFAEECES